jgi:hypothetical protein
MDDFVLDEWVRTRTDACMRDTVPQIECDVHNKLLVIDIISLLRTHVANYYS